MLPAVAMVGVHSAGAIPRRWTRARVPIKDAHLFPQPRFVRRPCQFPAFRPARAGFGTADRGAGHAAGFGHGGRPFRRCNSGALDQGQGCGRERAVFAGDDSPVLLGHWTLVEKFTV